MKQLSLIFLLVLSLFLFFGCTQVPTCGDGLCNGDETSLTCSVDCGIVKPETGYLQVTILDANTGLAIEGIEVDIQEVVEEECGLDLTSSHLAFNTDSKGIVFAKLDAEKSYVAAIGAGDYYPVEYKCAKVSSEKTALIDYELILLPAKPLCNQIKGTKELAIGESIDVNGTDGHIVQLKLDDYVINATTDEYDWVSMYQAKWVITYEDGIKKFGTWNPPVSLKLMFNNSFYNEVDFITTCWKEGNDLPFAVITSN